ncbi:hypothetical protein PVL29_006666 [Vitis rotundifolia]|uniref:PGG domain-containing protein n=1 Tax=Vitis rotundifolia TaxID=103349 RepID=A0AA39A6M2_VITRO|nr:hypothetical protein PVL29_006666 [Vitis rotundifolia]
MGLSTSIHTAESHTLYLEQVAAQDGSQTQISNQAADADGRQTPITCMDAALYKAAAYGRIDNTVLHIAAQFGQLDCGDTPLHLAAREGHSKVVEALIEAAKVSSEEIESGRTALHEAVRYHHTEVVKLLIKEHTEYTYGANITANTPLYMAAERGFDDLVEIIIHNDRTSTAHTGVEGRTALHAAVIRNDLEMTARLLDWKPNLTKEVDENGWSPLHCAAYLGHTAIVEQLLDKSPDKSVTYLGLKDSKKTALHIAANRNHQDIVKLLLSHSPDCCEQVDDKGNNVLHSAIISERYHAAGNILNDNSLLRVRRLINEKDAKGDTPLHLLASYQIVDPSFSEEEIRRQLREWENDVGPFGWQEAINKDSGGTSDGNSSKSEDVREDKIISNRKRQGETHLIVAALVATVTFAAGFTLPGGYNDSDGMAILTKRVAFKAFIVTDTIAVILSVSAVFVYFFMSLHKDGEFLAKHLIMGFFLTMFSMGAMVVAFMTGLYAVLPLSSGLPIVTCIICCIFLFAFYFVFRQVLKHVNE